jgi:hypothetical protein
MPLQDIGLHGRAEYPLEKNLVPQRRLAPQKRGRREKIVIDRGQSELSFDPKD